MTVAPSLLAVIVPNYSDTSTVALRALRSRMRARLAVNANPDRAVRTDLNLLPVYTQILDAVEAELSRRTGDK